MSEEHEQAQKRFDRRRLSRLAALAVLAAVAAAYGIVAFRDGLDHTPDSGMYMLCGAELFLKHDLSVVPSMYAPGFPLLISGLLQLTPSAGNAGTIVQLAALSVTLLTGFFAARSMGADDLLAGAVALLVAFYPSTEYALSFQLTEGTLIAAYVSSLAAWLRWHHTGRRSWLFMALAISGCMPFVKYAAAYAPLAIALFSVVFATDRGTRLRLRLLPLAYGVAALVPCGSYLIWNRLRDGAVTTHGASKVGFWDNLRTASSTVVDSASGWYLVVVIVAFGVIALAALVPSCRRRSYAHPGVLLGAALALGYLGTTIVSASIVQVDALRMRLCAPGITTLFLSIVLAMTHALGAFDKAAWPALARRAPYGAAVALGLVALGPNLADLGTALGEVLRHERTSTRHIFQPGFRRSVNYSALLHFYAEQLQRRRAMSVTFVEATSTIGQIRRDYSAIAGILGNAPRRLPELGRLALRAAHWDKIEFDVGYEGHSVAFLPSDISEARGFATPRTEDHPAVQARIATVVQQVMASARSYALGEHWVLVPKRAAWFRLASELLEPVRVEESRLVGSYRAYRLRL